MGIPKNDDSPPIIFKSGFVDWILTLGFGFGFESRATLACLYRTSGRFYMLKLTSVNSRHFTEPELSLQ